MVVQAGTVMNTSWILKMAGLAILAAACLAPCAGASETILFPSGTAWRYLDDGSDQGVAWRTNTFDDTAWLSGPAPLGYGHPPLEKTVISYGSNLNSKFVTSYFRKTFAVTNAASYSTLRLRLLRDDGAVLYMNGNEIMRTNMPVGAITYTSLASIRVGDPDEISIFESFLPAASLVEGTNLITAEVHQYGGTSSDVEFGLELSASTAVPPLRGPYLQSSSSSSIVIRWRTGVATDSRVDYGTNCAALNYTSTLSAAAMDHIVALTNLSADTKYYYAVGSTGSLIAGGEEDYYFRTHPLPGTEKPLRIWVIGDAGTKGMYQAAVRDAFYDFNGTNTLDAWLQLGDNAYETGTDGEYQRAVFEMYPTLLRHSVTWPTLGNHETAQSANYVDAYPYFDIFTLPTNGVAGGVPSGTEHYYSFDLGMVHFICLDSMTASRATDGAMATWLRSDLDVTTNRWLIAFWHHPPYTKGSHDSDAEPQLGEMRANILPILEDGGVDLVFCGHSHSYERSKLINGHYGLSSTFSATSHVMQGGSGRETNGVGAYHKPDGLGERPIGNRGTVYTVAGSSGQAVGSGALNHPAMYYSELALGSVVLDFDSNRVDVLFLRNTGATNDSFTVIKDGTYPPRFKGFAARTNGDIELTVLCRGYRTNIVEASTNLLDSGGWNPISTNLTADDSFVFTDPGALFRRTQFYRIRRP
jgi:hypothetical protein